LVRSLLRGWRAGEGGWHWIRAHAPKVRRVWIFLDASRSTGGGGSLAHFRRTLAGCLPRAAKIRFLLLHADRFHWVDRDASADSIQKTLATLASAAGGSPLGTAIQKLKRDIQRTGTTSCSQIFFCSDGLPQPNAGQTPVETRTALTRALRKLCRLLPAGNVFWFAPPGARAQAGWLRKLLSGTGVLLQE
jgi:hypothetical protein